MTHPDKPTAARELAEAVRDLSSHLSVPACWQPEVANLCRTIRPDGCERCLCNEWQVRMQSALSRYDAAREVWEDEGAVGRAVRALPGGSWDWIDNDDMKRALRAALEGGDDADA